MAGWSGRGDLQKYYLMEWKPGRIQVATNVLLLLLYNLSYYSASFSSVIESESAIHKF